VQFFAQILLLFIICTFIKTPHLLIPLPHGERKVGGREVVLIAGRVVLTLTEQWLINLRNSGSPASVRNPLTFLNFIEIIS
jgi:hypothetical protein